MLFKSVFDSLSEYSIVRDLNLCISCSVCVGQCSYDVHRFHQGLGRVLHDNLRCKGCRRCEALCPTGAIAVMRNCMEEDCRGHSVESEKLRMIIQDYDERCSCWAGMDVIQGPFSCFDDTEARLGLVTVLGAQNGRVSVSVPIILTLSGICAENPNLRKAVRECVSNLGTVCDIHSYYVSDEPELAELGINVLEAEEFMNSSPEASYSPIAVRVDSSLEGVEEAFSAVESGAGIIFIGRKGTPDMPPPISISMLHRKLESKSMRQNCSIVAEGCVRQPMDVFKALILGADAFSMEFPVLRAVGCTACSGCIQGQCPWGIATADPVLYKRLNPAMAARRIEDMVKRMVLPLKAFMETNGIASLNELVGRRDLLCATGLSDREMDILGLTHVSDCGGGQ